MSSNQEPVIAVNNLGKRYILYDQPQDRLKHMLFWRFGRHYGHPFWALKDVNFEIQKGETFGVIGKNGSGKSTLLQILAGTLEQSIGTAVAHGKTSALLELGAGFNPEFTGRENVYLYGNILGISPTEMKDRFDEIAAFADIGEFIEQPIKIYSSGMFVRLAFAVAAGVDADILLIDEALAVGDIFFRQKCYQRLGALRKKGATIVLVSHGLNEVEQFCDRALLLNKGEPVFLGGSIEAVKRYYLIDQLDRLQAIPPEVKKEHFESLPEEGENRDEFPWPAPNAFLDLNEKKEVSNGWAHFTRVAVCNQAGQPCALFEQGETASFFYELEVLQDIEVPTGGIEFVNEKGIIVHGKNTLLYGTPVPVGIRRGRRLRFRFDISLEIAVGEYTFSIGAATLLKSDYDQRALLTHIELDAKTIIMSIFAQVGQFAVAYRRYGQPVQLQHNGLANLLGQASVQLVATDTTL
jgi:lipopolysaccharide transport system ATP-binding protein